jgi:predicted nucleotidyltransferase
MDRETIIARLKAHRAELESLGVVSASLFGSTARGDNTSSSDVDIAVKLDPARTPQGFRYAGYLSTLERRLEAFLENEVDVVPEPARKLSLQQRIDRDRVVAF